MQPVPLPSKPTYTPADVSVVVATFDAGDNFEDSLKTWVTNEPLEIIIVAVAGFDQELSARISVAVNSVSSSHTQVHLLRVPHPGKRQQLARGIGEARGSILVLADDDVFWPPRLLPLVLAGFEEAGIGGVGTTQEGRLGSQGVTERTDAVALGDVTIWEYLGARRLQRRNKDISAMNYLQTAVTCLSGRTAAYRAHILKSPEFLDAFVNDYWLGRFLLDSGDDTFITRWLLGNGWKLRIQTDPDARIATLLAPTAKFLRQIVRWSRNTRRSFLRCIFLIEGFPQ